MSTHPTWNVQCPVCRAALVVDAETGVVLSHQETKPPPPVTDIVEAVHKLKDEASRREDVFRKSVEAEKNKGDRLKKTFEEALRRAKENPDALPPKREIDLD